MLDQLNKLVHDKKITDENDIDILNEMYINYEDKTYGCFKAIVESDINQTFFYGFENNEASWTVDTCVYIGKTSNKLVFDVVKEVFPIFRPENIYCEQCLIEKNADSAINLFRGNYIWEHTFDEVRDNIAESLMLRTSLKWKNVRTLKRQKPYVIFSSCPQHAKTIYKEMIDDFEKEIDFVFNLENSLYLINCKENYLELFLADNLELIEEGMELIETQFSIENGIIDILARDKSGVLCIIELKVVGNEERILFQTAYYPTQFDEPVRMITIAPNYDKKIYLALNNINIETLNFYLDDEDQFSIKEYVPEYDC